LADWQCWRPATNLKPRTLKPSITTDFWQAPKLLELLHRNMDLKT
jgi:hypothetical protein